MGRLVGNLAAGQTIVVVGACVLPGTSLASAAGFANKRTMTIHDFTTSHPRR